MKHLNKSLVLLLALLSLSAFARTNQETATNVLAVQQRYQNLLLKMNGVKLVMTATCDTKSGELKTDSSQVSPQFSCIAVKVNSPSDLPAIEAVYSNPLKLDGALIHFTDRDPLPSKGGITVHN